MDRDALTVEIRELPNAVHRVLVGLSDHRLESRYKNWTIRQISHVHADSHGNSYIRFKWTFTEDQPIRVSNERVEG